MALVRLNKQGCALSMPEKEKPVASPCVSVCALDIDDICMGCYRTGQEISYWGKMSNEEKHEVLRRCAERESKSFKPFCGQ